MSYESSTGAGSSGSGNRTITAFFDDRSEADRAVERLVSAGISRSEVRVVAGDSSSSSGSSGMSSSSSSSSSGGGGFWDSLADLFMPDEDRHTYAEGLRRGGYLVTVNASSAHYDRALDILDDDGTIDIGEREQSWRSEGWTGYTGGTGSTGMGAGSSGPGMTGSGAGYGGTGAGMTGTGAGITGAGAGLGGSGMSGGSTSMSGSARGEEVIPVAEEKLRVGKRDVSHGRVRVRSYVVETPVSEQVSLREENVSIERRPVDRPLGAGDRMFEDRTIEVEERSEEAVVAKEARVREELVVNKQVGERTETVTDTVRHTEVDVEDDRTDTTRTGYTTDTSRNR